MPMQLRSLTLKFLESFLFSFNRLRSVFIIIYTDGTYTYSDNTIISNIVVVRVDIMFTVTIIDLSSIMFFIVWKRTITIVFLFISIIFVTCMVAVSCL